MQRLCITLWLTAIMIFSVAVADIMNIKNEITVVSGTLSLPQGSYVIYEESKDINSDGKDEKIYVYGKKKSIDSSDIYDINAAVFNSQGILHRTSAKGVNGINEQIIIEDFNGDRIKEVAVILDNDKYKSCFVGDFSHSIPKNIMAAKNLRGLEMRLTPTKGFKITSQLENGQLFSINLEGIKDRLISKGMYSQNGDVIKGTPIITPLTNIEAVKTEEGYYNFKFTQKIITKEDKTVLCIVESEMEYTNDTLLVKRIEYYIE